MLLAGRPLPHWHEKRRKSLSVPLAEPANTPYNGNRCKFFMKVAERIYGVFVGTISFCLFAPGTGRLPHPAPVDAQRRPVRFQPAVLCLGRAAWRAAAGGARRPELGRRPGAGARGAQTALAGAADRRRPGGAAGLQICGLRRRERQFLRSRPAAGVRPRPAAGHQLLPVHLHRLLRRCGRRAGGTCAQPRPFFRVSRLLRARPFGSHRAVRAAAAAAGPPRGSPPGHAGPFLLRYQAAGFRSGKKGCHRRPAGADLSAGDLGARRHAARPHPGAGLRGLHDAAVL